MANAYEQGRTDAKIKQEDKSTVTPGDHPKSKDKEKKIAGMITVSSDDEEEAKTGNEQDLRDRLQKAEQKVTMLTSVLETTHDTAMQVSQWGIQSYQKMKSVATLTGYAKDVKDGIKNSRGMNEAIAGLTAKFPETVRRVVSHRTNERASLNTCAPHLPLTQTVLVKAWTCIPLKTSCSSRWCLSLFEWNMRLEPRRNN